MPFNSRLLIEFRSSSLRRDESVPGNFSGSELIRVAPHPGFARLDRADQRMLGMVKVLSRMFVPGGIAAAHVPALQAETKVDPGISGLDAVFTDVLIRAGQLDVVQMSTLGHNSSVVLISDAQKSRALQFRERSMNQMYGNCALPHG
jgi:hypothetical protein